jgi:hypothetical protein
MKRDMDLVRDLLLRLEEHYKDRVSVTEVGVLGPDRQRIVGHLRLLADGGYVEMTQTHLPSGAPILTGWRLTWKGHEFLDQVRDPEIWRQTKAAAGRVGSWSVTVLASLAAGFIKAKAATLGFPIQ